MTITIGPEKIPAFESHGSYFCRYCQAYTDNFYPSYVKHRKRECKSCIQKRIAQRNADPLVKLRFKLYQALYDQGAESFAKALSTRHIATMFMYHNVKDPSKVKRILVPPKQFWNDLTKYRIEYNDDDENGLTS